MKKPVQKFEDLYVWQKARELTKEVYSSTIPWKDYSLKDQIRRASVSVISNIAEGFERGSKQEFLYFLYVARGSCGEIRSQLYVAFDQKYLTYQQFTDLMDKADHTSRLLAKFISGYKQKGHAGQKFSKPIDQDLEDFKQEMKDLVPEKYRF